MFRGQVKYINRYLKLWATIVTCLVLLIPSSALATLGISPPAIQVDDVTRLYGQVVSVNILRNDGLIAETYAVEFQGEDARFLEGPDMIKFPAGVTIIPYTFTILPTEAAIGDYSAKILFLPQLGEGDLNQGAGTILRRGVQLILSFSVSDKQIIAFDIKTVEFAPTEEMLPIILEIRVMNQGNTEWRPDEIIVSFFDAGSGNLIATESFDGSNLNVWKPGETRIELVDFATQLPAGQYKTEAKFLVGSVVVHTVSPDLQVFLPGTLEQSGELTSFTSSKENYEPGEQVVMLGTFENTGSIPVLSRMIIELYSEDNKLIDTLVGKSFSVGRNESTTFRAFTEFSQEGVYKMVGYVEFGHKVSSTKILTVNVSSEAMVTSIASATDHSLFLLIGGIALLLLLIVLFILWRRRGKKVLAPIVKGPLYIGSTIISGMSEDEAGSIITVYSNDTLIGAAKVTAGAWQLALQPGKLVIGAWITATVTRDLNNDGKVDSKDATSLRSEGVTVEADLDLAGATAMVAPVKTIIAESLVLPPVAPVSPLASPVQTPEVIPVVPVDTSEIKSNPQPVLKQEKNDEVKKLVEDKKEKENIEMDEGGNTPVDKDSDDLWTISL